MKNIKCKISIFLNIILVFCLLFNNLDGNKEIENYNNINTVNEETTNTDKTIDEITKYKNPTVSSGQSPYANLNNRCIDIRYKLFYGKWKVTEIMSVNENIPSSFNEDEKVKREQLIGKEIFFDSNVVFIEEFFINYLTLSEVIPEYRYYIIPRFENDGIPGYIYFEELGINEDYFVCVEANLFNKDTLKSEATLDFLIKDDNTLYLLGYDACYKMERLEYIKEDIDFEMISWVF